MPSPRVLLLLDQLGGGGTERQLVHLLRGAERRIEAYCHVLNPGGVWEAAARGLTAEFSHSSHRAPVARGLEFVRLIRRLRPDVVHSWHSYTCVYPLVSKSLHRRPVIASLRGDVTKSSDTGVREFRSFYHLLRFADAVVSNNGPALRSLEAHGVRFRRALVVRNGIEPGPPAEPRAADGPVRIVGLGRLGGVKNWAQLIRVCGRLIRRGAAISLSIFGEGPDRPQLERLCGEYGMDPRAVLPGYRTDTASILSRADILAHCARSEGSPNAVLEGLAAGLPVVVSDLEVCRELADGGDFVQLFPVGDDDACLRRLDWLVQHPELRGAMGERARRFIAREYDCGAMADRYVALYEEFAAGVGPCRPHPRNAEAAG